MYVLNHYRPFLVVGIPQDDITDDVRNVEVVFASEPGTLDERYVTPQILVDDEDPQYIPLEEFLNDQFEGHVVYYREYQGPMRVRVGSGNIIIIAEQGVTLVQDLRTFLKTVRVPNGDHPYFARRDA